MKLSFFTLVSFLVFSSIASANVCEKLFTYEEGQALNRVDESKVNTISEFKLTADSIVYGLLEAQVMEVMGDYGNTNFIEAVLDTDDEEVLVTIAQNKQTKEVFTIVQAFMGDTETGKVFSVSSSVELAELGDGECSN